MTACTEACACIYGSLGGTCIQIAKAALPYIHVSIPRRNDTCAMTYTQPSVMCVCEVEFVIHGVQVRTDKILSTVGGLPDVRSLGKSAMDMGCL